MGKTSDHWEQMFSPDKVKPKPEIWCYKGKHNSGFVTSDLLAARGDYTLNCKVCGEVCCKSMASTAVTVHDLSPELKKFL